MILAVFATLFAAGGANVGDGLMVGIIVLAFFEVGKPFLVEPVALSRLNFDALPADCSDRLDKVRSPFFRIELERGMPVLLREVGRLLMWDELGCERRDLTPLLIDEMGCGPSRRRGSFLQQ